MTTVAMTCPGKSHNTCHSTSNFVQAKQTNATKPKLHVINLWEAMSQSRGAPMRWHVQLHSSTQMQEI